jgi:hypothetical protein
MLKSFELSFWLSESGERLFDGLLKDAFGNANKMWALIYFDLFGAEAISSIELIC